MIALLAVFACGEPTFEPNPGIEITGYLDGGRISWTRASDGDPAWIAGEPDAAGEGEVTAFEGESDLGAATVAEDGSFFLEVDAAVTTTLEVRQGDADPVSLAIAPLPPFPTDAVVTAHTPGADGIAGIDVVLAAPTTLVRLVATAPATGEVTTLTAEDAVHFVGHLAAGSGTEIAVYGVGSTGSTAPVLRHVP
jgi:hypothetical protein